MIPFTAHHLHLASHFSLIPHAHFPLYCCMQETIFSKIIRREIPADILYQDELVTAFRDIHPQAPTHILIVPNKHIPTVADVSTEDELAIGRMFTVAQKLGQQEGLHQGYRLIVNCKEHGGQEVYHLHMHLLGGKALGPMLSRGA